LIVLVGLPGSGKSTVGKQLAKRLQLSFVDSDQEIENRLGCSIREYFEREGESAFRDVEQQVMAELLAGPLAVLSTGGGVVLREANRAQLKHSGKVFYLRATPEDLMRRLKNDRTRPLLQVADPLAKLRELYAQRDPLYREVAHYVVETGRPTVANLVNIVVMQLELQPEEPAHRSAST
jgi:shikimate kinase